MSGRKKKSRKKAKAKPSPKDSPPKVEDPPEPEAPSAEALPVPLSQTEGLDKLPLIPFEAIDGAQQEALDEYQEWLNLGGQTFGQSWYSELHYVLKACILPKRTWRQAMLHFDGKQHAMAEAKAGEAKSAAKLTKIKGDIRILEKLRKKVDKATAQLNLPPYRCELVEHETVTTLTFDPEQIMGAYEQDEWQDCKAHLLTELDSLLTMKRAELAQIQRGQFQQKKLVTDAERELAHYKEILPKLKAEADASKLSFEEEERLYWKLRNKRTIETKIMEKHTGIPHDHWESMGNMDPSDFAEMVEFFKETDRMYRPQQIAGPDGRPTLSEPQLPSEFRYQKHIVDTTHALTGGTIDSAKQLAMKAGSERSNKGNITLGLLFRTPQDAENQGACDPAGMLFSPRGYNVKPFYACGSVGPDGRHIHDRTDVARNKVVQAALTAEGATEDDWIFFVDDDCILPKMALRDLLNLAIEHNWKVVAGDYPLKKNPYESASLVIVPSEKGTGAAVSPVLGYDDQGNPRIPVEVIQAGLVDAIDYAGQEIDVIDCNSILATGCMLIHTSVLRAMGGEWFKEYRQEIAPGVSEMHKTDDYPFTQRCIEMGIMPKLIPFIRCQHVDFKHRKVYGNKDPEQDYCINNRANPFIIAAESGQHNPRAVVYIPRRSMAHIPYTETGLLSKPKCIGIAVPEPPVGIPWSECWTHMARTAIDPQNQADFMIIIEDDMIIPKNAVAQLLHSMQENDYAFIGGAYVRKDMTNESVHITTTVIEKDGSDVTQEIPFPDPFECRGLVENNHVVSFGCSIIDLRVFADMPSPWFVDCTQANPHNPVTFAYQGRPITITTPLTHDAFFTNRLRMMGCRCAVDTDLQCLHCDPATGRVYGPSKFVTEDYELRLREADRFAITQETLQRIRVSAK